MDRHLNGLLSVFLLLIFLAFPNLSEATTSDDFAQTLSDIKSLESGQERIAKYEDLLSSALDDSQKARVLHFLGADYANTGQLKKAIEPLKQALELTPLQAKKADINRLLGLIYYYLDEATLAIKHYTNALSYQLANEAHIKSADLENNIALAFEKSNNYSSALLYYQRAEPRYLAHGKLQDVLDIQLNRAGLLSKLGHFEDAISTYQNLLTTYQMDLDKPTTALARSNLAVVLNQVGKYEQSIKHSEAALNFYRSKEDKYNIATTLLNLADSQIWLTNYQNARILLSEATALSRTIDNANLAYNIAYHQARVAIALGNSDIAYEQITKAIELAKKANNQHALQKAYTQALIIFSAAGHLQQANSALVKRKSISQQIQQQEMRKQLAQERALVNLNELETRIDELEKESKISELALDKAKQQRIFVIIAGLLFVLLIIAAQRRSHEKRAKQQLEQLVKKRTFELEQTSEDLKKASLVKSKFLANMSHEIRTPLTAIIGHSESMQSVKYDLRNLNKDLHIIINNGRHLLDLINDILDISRIEENKLELDIQPFNLSGLIDEIDHMFSSLAEKKGIHFGLNNMLPDDLGIQADPFRLKQILLNLCSNAVKFTDQGAVTLSVRETPHGVRFNVTDTGIGMEPSQLEEIFDSFTQGDSSISRRFGGSGLGLCLSEQLANLMQGSISVTSELGNGSEFTLHLRVDKLRVLAKPKPKPTLQAASFEGRVLIAEDHDDNRELITRLLSHLGLDVIAVNNGLKAVEACKEKQFDLVLMDIQMPKLDGIGALQKLKQAGFSRPVVAITANTMQHEIDSYLALGFSDHIKKPIEQDNFLSTLDKYLTSKSDVLLQKAQAINNSLAANDDLALRFKSSLQDEQARLVTLYQAKDWLALQALLHKLKGAAAMFNYHSIVEASDYFEKALKYNDLEAFDEAFEGVNYALSSHI